MLQRPKPDNEYLTDLLQTVRFSTSLGQQGAPVVWRMTARQHFTEHPIGVIAALVGSLRVLVVDPCIDDDLAL
jgi:hypothetical protein